MARVIIRDANGDVQGNPKGYLNHAQAQKQGDGRLYAKLEAIAAARSPDLPEACRLLYSCKWELV